jgi:peptide/nickel transport system ATP-binding protein
VVAELADDILVMYGGRCVEHGSAETVFRNPEHPYTWGLLGSMPRLDREVRDRLMPIKGTPPSLIHLPPGCAFHPRCGYAGADGIPCRTATPTLEPAQAGHEVACHMPSAKRREAFRADIAPNL